MNIQSARESYFESAGFWAIDLINSLDANHPGHSLVWAGDCLSALLVDPKEKLVSEARALVTALACNDSDTLIHLAEPFEGVGQTAISLAIANFMVAKALYLRENGSRARFFLNAAMTFIRTYCRENRISPDVLFALLPST